MGAVLHPVAGLRNKAIRPREHASILAFFWQVLNQRTFASLEQTLGHLDHACACGADMWLSFVARYEEFSNHSLWQDLGARAISSAALTAALKGIRLPYHRQVQTRAEKGKPWAFWPEKFQASHLLFRTRLVICKFLWEWSSCDGVGELRCLERGETETSGKKQIKLFFYLLFFFIFCSMIDVIFIFNTRICVFIIDIINCQTIQIILSYHEY